MLSASAGVGDPCRVGLMRINGTLVAVGTTPWRCFVRAV